MTPEAFAKSLDLEGHRLGKAAMEKLKLFDEFFQEQAAIHNLVARKSLPERWERHYLDSAQLYQHLPEGASTLVDLGSGAGFPGLVLAAMGEDKGLSVTLVESTGKKANFLEAAVKQMGLNNVQIEKGRIENYKPASSPDVITARALASLSTLCELITPFVGPTTVCLFSKGRKAREELTEAREHWHMSVKEIASMTSDEGIILEVTELKPNA